METETPNRLANQVRTVGKLWLRTTHADTQRRIEEKGNLPAPILALPTPMITMTIIDPQMRLTPPTKP